MSKDRGRKISDIKKNLVRQRGFRIGIYFAAVFLLSFIFFDFYLNRHTKTTPEVSKEEAVAYSEADKKQLEAIFDEVSFYDETADNNIQIKTEEVLRPELLDNLDAEKVEEEEQELGFKFIKLPEDEYNAILDAMLEEDGDEEALAQKYEEELPDNIIIQPIAETKSEEKASSNTQELVKSNIIPPQKPSFLKQPHIAVVIDDMGISARRTADIASLKAPLTASFLTYSKNLAAQIENSRRAGQEIIIHVPMEAQSNVDVAPDVLTTAMSPDEIKQNLLVMLNKFDGVKGVNNHMGSKLTEDKKRMLAVMEVLKQNNLFFLDSKTSPKSKAEDAAAEQGVAYAHRHVFIDNQNEKKYILGQLKKAEKIAMRNGYAIAIGHPKSQTYEALKEWIPQLAEKNIALTSLSEIISVLHPKSKISD